MPFATPFFVADVLPSTSWQKSPAMAPLEGETDLLGLQVQEEAAPVDAQASLGDQSATPGGPAYVTGPAKGNPELTWVRNDDPWDPATRALPFYKAYTSSQLKDVLAKKKTPAVQP